MSTKVGDLIRVGVNDFWRVEGVHLGGNGQEDVVELVRLGVTGPCVYGETRRTSLIPERLLRALVDEEQAHQYTEPR